MAYCLVLDDELFKEFHAFKRGEKHSIRIINKLLHLYKPNHLTNIDQIQRVGIRDLAIIAQYASSNRFFVRQMSLVDLSENTIYKIILSTKRTDFPYVNVDSSIVGSFFTITAKPTEPRTHIQDYLKTLLKNAREVVICDRYFDGTPQKIGRNCITKGSEKVFALFPSHLVNVFFEIDQTPTSAQTTKISDTCINHIQVAYPNIVICSSIRNNYEDHHDRYLLIDNQIEVIITSGIDYLFDTTKECTIIVRQV